MYEGLLGGGYFLDDGAAVCPGDILFAVRRGAAHDVQASAGCTQQQRLVAPPPPSQTEAPEKRKRDDAADTARIAVDCFVATRRGLVQWKDNVVSVLPAAPAGEVDLRAAPAAECTVHLRVQRVGLTHVVGEIFAVDGRWCLCDAFRGSLRQEDIRPPPPLSTVHVPCAESMRPGDVVVARCISQADARLYELSTLAPEFGVVEAVGEGGAGRGRVALKPIPGRRDAMLNPATGKEEKRWTPLS